jgi:hypothetical protein
MFQFELLTKRDWAFVVVVIAAGRCLPALGFIGWRQASEAAFGQRNELRGLFAV